MTSPVLKENGNAQTSGTKGDVSMSMKFAMALKIALGTEQMKKTVKATDVSRGTSSVQTPPVCR